MHRANAVRALDAEAELAAAVVDRSRGLHVSLEPKPELEAGAQHEQGKGRLSLDRAVPQQVAGEGGTFEWISHIQQ